MSEIKSEVRDGMRIDWDVPIRMDDGNVLRADVYRPVAEGKYPALVSYGPYGKGLAFQEGYKTAWEILRWPLLLVIVVGFLVCLYHYSSSLRPSWRDCLWGALVGAVLWIVAAVAFRAITELGLRTSGVAADDPTVQIIGQSVNAVIATVLWAYLASIAILLGGEFNVLLRDRREAQRNSVVGFPFV